MIALKSTVFAALMLIFVAGNGLALDHGGTIAANETWFAADNPHVVVDNVTVNAGITLTIQPGVEVYFNSSRRITTNGTMTAIGAPGQEILFTKNTASDWSYLYFTNSGSGNFAHCTIEESSNGLYANSSGSFSVSNVTFQNNTYGINAINTATISVSDCLFQDNNYGISITGGSIDLSSSSFIGNPAYGYHGTGVVPNLLDANNVFTDNGTGFYLADVASLNLITPMNITGSTTTGLHLKDCDGVTVNNQTLTGNVGTNGAFLIDDCGEFTLGAGNTIGGSGLENTWPVSIGLGSYPSASGVIPTSGNTNNDIQVAGGSSGKTGTWKKFTDLDYIVTVNSTIDAGGELIIEPGVNIRFGSGRRLTTNGTLTAVGAPGQEILFTKHTATDWSYLYFTGSGSGTFAYCTIEEGSNGLYANSSGSFSVSNVTFQNNSYGINAINTATLAVSDCLFQDNNYGISITGGSIDLSSSTFIGNATHGYHGIGVVPNLLDANNVFTDNGTGIYLANVPSLNLTTGMSITGSTTTGMHLKDCDEVTVDNQTLTGNVGTNGAFMIDDCGGFTLGAGNTIGGSGLENSWPVSIGAGSYPSAIGVIPTSGNTNNDIQVVGGSSDKTGTWRKFTDLDFIVTVNSTIDAGGELILEPGVNLRFGAGRRLTINGTLTAMGTPGQEILFTSNTGSDWNYLYFTNSGSGTFAYCTIEESSNGIYANSSGDFSASHVTFQNNNFGINAINTATLAVSDCLFQDNNNGITITGGSIDLSSSTFIGNATFGFHGTGVVPNLLDANNVFTDNGTGCYLANVVSLNLDTPMSISGSTTTGMHLKDCDGVTVDNQTLTGNLGTNGAFLIDDCGEFTLGAGNTIGGSGLENSWPVSIGLGSYPSASGVIPTVGNTNNDIQVVGGSSDKAGTWRKFTDLDYIVTINPAIDSGGELIVEPGVNIRFDAGRRITVNGTLTAVGAPGQEILFTRNTGSDWNYLYFTNSGGGTFAYCTIEESSNGIYANSSGNFSASHVTFLNNNYGINGVNTATFAVSDCLFQDNNNGITITGGSIDLGSSTFIGNATYGFQCTGVAPSLLDANNVFTDNGTGFYVADVASLNLDTPMSITGSTTTGMHLKDCDGATVDNQTLTGNLGTNGAFLIDDCGEFTLGAGNTIGGSGLENSWPVSIGLGSYPSAGGMIPTSGNTSNDIQVAGGSSNKTGTWREITDLDYIITVNPTIDTGGELILEPGVNLRFGAGRRLTINGTLTAIGAPGQEILFTKSTDADWNYLYFTSSGGGNMEYCTIEEATYGLYANSSGSISASNVTIQNCNYGINSVSSSTLLLSDCLLENNNSGIRASNGTISLIRNRIINNIDYGIYLSGAEPTFGTSLSEWNDIYGNGTGQPGRDLRNGVTDINAHYVHWGTLDHEQILIQIWDWHDDTDLGFVYVLPYVTASHQGEISAVDDPGPEQDIPLAFSVFQNAPNPFNPSTVIRFDLAGSTPVTLKVFDVSGALVATLVDDQLPAGHHQAVWHGHDDQGRSVSSGAYFYRIAAGKNIETRQMMLVK